MKQKCDVAAYVWPAFSDNPQTKRFWAGNMGEWESVASSRPKFDGHCQPRVPLWGYVNEASPAVMEMEIDAAVSHGVNVLIYDWYFYNGDFFLESCLRDGFLKARNVDKINFYLMWANHHVNGVWNKETASGEHAHDILWSGLVTQAQFERICARFIEYFAHPSYYKIDGKPVLCIYDLENFIESFGGMDGAKKAIEYFRSEVKKAGFKDVHLQGILYYESGADKGSDGLATRSTQLDRIEALGLDSVTHYQYVHMKHIDDKRDYSEVADECSEIMKKIAEMYKTPYVPHVTVGWDNNARYNDNVYTNIIAGCNPQAFEKACRNALELALSLKKSPRLVTVNSWNEWSEASYLQPDAKFGYGYLDAVKKVFTE